MPKTLQIAFQLLRAQRELNSMRNRKMASKRE
jgi:hypothetical protein